MNGTKTSLFECWASLVAGYACNARAPVSIPGGEDPLDKGMATHSSILAWESHEEKSLAGCSPWGQQRVRHDLVTKPPPF